MFDAGSEAGPSAAETDRSVVSTVEDSEPAQDGVSKVPGAAPKAGEVPLPHDSSSAPSPARIKEA